MSIDPQQLRAALYRGHARARQLVDPTPEKQLAAIFAEVEKLTGYDIPGPEELECRRQGQELERLQCQLAGCLTAAEGHVFATVEQGAYGWSPAYEAVVQLRKAFDQQAERILELTREVNSLQALRAALLPSDFPPPPPDPADQPPPNLQAQLCAVFSFMVWRLAWLLPTGDDPAFSPDTHRANLIREFLRDHGEAARQLLDAREDWLRLSPEELSRLCQKG